VVLVDRKGNIQPVSTRRGNYSEFSISPNGRSLASRVFAINDDIWTYDMASGAPLRFTFEPLDEIFPQWTADPRGSGWLMCRMKPDETRCSSVRLARGSVLSGIGCRI
jgi:hypothetical protein